MFEVGHPKFAVEFNFVLKLARNGSISSSYLSVGRKHHREKLAHGAFQMESSLSHVSDPDIAVHQEKWAQEQELLKKRLVLKDDFLWKIYPSLPNSEEGVGKNRLRYIGGVDLSFSKHDSSIACGALIVVDLNTLCIVYEDFDVVQLTMPYIPGFLAFRECHVLLGLLKKMKLNAHPFYPQLLMVDGNGILHPRGFGLASHLAILSDLPTIGVGKNALRFNESCAKPIFISIGHRISLETAIAIVRMCCRFRVPEPIRQADIRSREYLQKKLRSTGKS